MNVSMDKHLTICHFEPLVAPAGQTLDPSILENLSFGPNNVFSLAIAINIKDSSALSPVLAAFTYLAMLSSMNNYFLSPNSIPTQVPNFELNSPSYPTFFSIQIFH
jgi:hypothetical protein